MTSMNNQPQSTKRALLFSVILGVSMMMAITESFSQDREKPDGGRQALTLYGVDLKHGSTKEFLDAARKAGAKQTNFTGGVYYFDAHPTGVPALKSFSLVTDNSSVLLVQFEVEAYEGNETLRKMLTSKYGEPKPDKSGAVGQFNKQYVPEGTYTWDFSGGMQLIFKKGFFSREVSLSYKNLEKFNLLVKNAKSTKDSDAKSRASALVDKF